MQIFYGFDALPRFVRPAVTVGSYDGVHRGHRALIEELTAAARAAGGQAVVVTFDPHPRITLGRAEGLRELTPLAEKAGLLAGLGVDALVVVPFDRAFSRLTGAEFLEKWLIGRLGAETLVAGYNHRFGCDRCEAVSWAGRSDIRVIRVAACTLDGEAVSSTAIRRLLDAGDTAAAERLLGHPIAATRTAQTIDTTGATDTTDTKDANTPAAHAGAPQYSDKNSPQ